MQHTTHSTPHASRSTPHSTFGAFPVREALTLSIPCHWLAPALYGDVSSLSYDERAAFLRWVRDTKEELGHGKDVAIGRIHDAPYVARYHDAAEYGVAMCMCVDVEMLVEIGA